MKSAEYILHDGYSLAHLIKQKEIQPSEVLEAAIARCEEVNPQINAVVIKMYDIARDKVTALPSGALSGVPFLLKDLHQEYGGVNCTNGSKSYRKIKKVPEKNSELVERWLSAGLIPLGRTNTPEFGLKGITEPELWGACRNPHDTRYSSGGSAASVAARIVPIAGASDGGGSIRIPSAYCGVFGLKPSRGRISWGSQLYEVMHGASVPHAITRSVRDSALMLDVTQGYNLSDLFEIKPPTDLYLNLIKVPPKKLKIAFSVTSPLNGGIATHTKNGILNTVKILQSLGHEVIEDSPSIQGKELAKDFIAMWFSQCAYNVQQLIDKYKLTKDDFEIETNLIYMLGKNNRTLDYLSMLKNWGKYTFEMNKFFQKYDLYLTPTTAYTAPLIGDSQLSSIQRIFIERLLNRITLKFIPIEFFVDKIVSNNITKVPFTQLANITGLPAMSVPLTKSFNGLPIGSQFIGSFGREDILLQLAAQLEQSAPWDQSIPLIIN